MKAVNAAKEAEEADLMKKDAFEELKRMEEVDSIQHKKDDGAYKQNEQKVATVAKSFQSRLWPPRSYYQVW